MPARPLGLSSRRAPGAASLPGPSPLLPAHPSPSPASLSLGPHFSPPWCPPRPAVSSCRRGEAQAPDSQAPPACAPWPRSARRLVCSVLRPSSILPVSPPSSGALRPPGPSPALLLRRLFTRLPFRSQRLLPIFRRPPSPPHSGSDGPPCRAHITDLFIVVCEHELEAPFSASGSVSAACLSPLLPRPRCAAGTVLPC